MQITDNLQAAFAAPIPRDESKIRKNSAIILQGIKSKGDTAVAFYTKELYKLDIKDFTVGEAEIARAADTLPQSVRQWLSMAIVQAQKAHGWPQAGRHRIETSPSQWVWTQATPIASVGIYTETHTTADIGNLLNLLVLAQSAGVGELSVCLGAQSDGDICPMSAFLVQQMGIARVYKAAGAMAIGAMAYGTQSIAKVGKIFGVGGAYANIAAALLEGGGHKLIRKDNTPLVLIADSTTDLEKLALDVYLAEKTSPDAPIKAFFFDAAALQKFAGLLRARVLFDERKTPGKDYPMLQLVLAKEIQPIADWANGLPSAQVALSFENAEAYLGLFGQVSGTVCSTFWHSCFLQASAFYLSDFQQRARLVSELTPLSDAVGAFLGSKDHA